MVVWLCSVAVYRSLYLLSTLSVVKMAISIGNTARGELTRGSSFNCDGCDDRMGGEAKRAKQASNEKMDRLGHDKKIGKAGRNARLPITDGIYLGSCLH